MAIGRTCTGVYSIGNLAECVDTFCAVLLPAAALRYFKGRSILPHEVEFHRQQCIDLIRESDLQESDKVRLILRVERSYQKALRWAGEENA